MPSRLRGPSDAEDPADADRPEVLLRAQLAVGIDAPVIVQVNRFERNAARVLGRRQADGELRRPLFLLRIAWRALERVHELVAGVDGGEQMPRPDLAAPHLETEGWLVILLGRCEPRHVLPKQ